MDLEEDKINNRNQIMIILKIKDTHKEEEESLIIIKILKEILKMLKTMETEGEANISIKEGSKIIEEVTMEIKINKKMNIIGK
jgi:hypothetical protein